MLSKEEADNLQKEIIDLGNKVAVKDPESFDDYKVNAAVMRLSVALLHLVDKYTRPQGGEEC